MNRVYIFVIATYIIPIGLLHSDYTLKYTSNAFTFYQQNGFDRINAVDFMFVGLAGAPELPVDGVNYIIPPNKKVDSITLISYTRKSIPGQYYIYPMQPAARFGDTVPWVDPDSSIYQSDSFYPKNIISIVNQGVFDGAKILTIAVKPIQYRPQSRRLYLTTNISFRLHLSMDTMPAMRAKIRVRSMQTLYNRLLEQIVENDYEILCNYQSPSLVEKAPFSPSFAPAVIIAPDAFKPYFQPYADWLTDQGIQSVIISPEWIYANVNGCDEQEQIRNYIKWCYMEWGGVFFILGGDDYYVPVRITVPNSDYQSENDSIPCDHYYADLTGIWNWDNGNPDEYWGEIDDDLADCYAEVFVGRISAYCIEEVQNWVEKALHYEKNANILYNKTLWINDGYYNSEAHGKFPEYFFHRDIFSGDADLCFYAIDSAYAFVNLNCHGNIGDYDTRHAPPRAAHYSWLSGYPNPAAAGLNHLTNKDKYFFIYALSCHCGAFDQYAHVEPAYPSGSDTCIADAYVDAYKQNYNGEMGPFGANAGVFQTRSPWLWFEPQTWFYEGLFECPANENDTIHAYLGKAIAYSKAKLSLHWNSYYWRHGGYCQNLFGSPATEAWTNLPESLIVEHPNNCVFGITIPFTVTVRTNTMPSLLINKAKVCLNKPGDIYDIGITDDTGEVTFYITPQTCGIIKVTVTRYHNEAGYLQYFPSQTFCSVIDPGSGGSQSSRQNILLPRQLCIMNTSTMAAESFILKYGIAKRGNVKIWLCDIMGNVIIKKEIENHSAGYFSETLDVGQLPKGLYFIMLKQHNEFVTQKFLRIK